MSLYKLNSLETQMRTLSKLAVKQVDATNQLLRNAKEEETLNESDDSTERVNKVMNNVTLVRDAEIQTTFGCDLNPKGSPIPPPPAIHDDNDSVKRAESLSLTVSLLKWNIFMLKQQMKCMNEKKVKEKIPLIKEIVGEVIGIQSKGRNDVEEYQQRELRKKDEIITTLKSQIKQVEERLKQMSI